MKAQAGTGFGVKPKTAPNPKQAKPPKRIQPHPAPPVNEDWKQAPNREREDYLSEAMRASVKYLMKYEGLEEQATTRLSQPAGENEVAAMQRPILTEPSSNYEELDALLSSLPHDVAIKVAKTVHDTIFEDEDEDEEKGGLQSQQQQKGFMYESGFSTPAGVREELERPAVEIRWEGKATKQQSGEVRTASIRSEPTAVDRQQQHPEAAISQEQEEQPRVPTQGQQAGIASNRTHEELLLGEAKGQEQKEQRQSATAGQQQKESSQELRERDSRGPQSFADWTKSHKEARSVGIPAKSSNFKPGMGPLQERRHWQQPPIIPRAAEAQPKAVPSPDSVQGYSQHQPPVALQAAAARALPSQVPLQEGSQHQEPSIIAQVATTQAALPSPGPLQGGSQHQEPSIIAQVATTQPALPSQVPLQEGSQQQQPPIIPKVAAAQPAPPSPGPLQERSQQQQLQSSTLQSLQQAFPTARSSKMDATKAKLSVPSLPNSQFEFGPLPTDFFFGPKAASLRAEQYQVVWQHKQGPQARSIDQDKRKEEGPSVQRGQDPSQEGMLESPRVSGQQELQGQHHTEQQGMQAQQQRQQQEQKHRWQQEQLHKQVAEIETQEHQGGVSGPLNNDVHAELCLAQSRVAALTAQVTEASTLSQEIMAMNQELVASNQQLLNAMPAFLELTKSHKAVVGELAQARAQLESMKKEMDAHTGANEGHASDDQARILVKEQGIAERQVLLTHKIAVIMRSVLANDQLDKDTKVALGGSISEMLQLLLQ